MNKFLIISFLVVFFLVLSVVANAASTIGTNMSTTGTFTQTVGSATAARFQNAAGTTTVLWIDTTNTKVGVNAGADLDTVFEVGGTASISGISTWADGQFRPQLNGTTAFRFQNAAGTTSVLTIDTTNGRVGIGGTPGTTFEVQGTASASYFLTGNTIQVGGFASVAYSRFGTNATTYSGDLSATNDLLISGNLEVDLKSYFDNPAEFQGTASASYFLTGNTIQVGGFASVAYSRFGTTATTHGNYISTTNDLFVSGDFEVRGTVSFGGNASISQNFAAGRGATATSSFTFDTGSTTKGACIIIKDNDGSGFTYLTVSNGVATFDTSSCE